MKVENTLFLIIIFGSITIATVYKIRSEVAHSSQGKAAFGLVKTRSPFSSCGVWFGALVGSSRGWSQSRVAVAANDVPLCVSIVPGPGTHRHRAHTFRVRVGVCLLTRRLLLGWIGQDLTSGGWQHLSIFISLVYLWA